MEKISGQGNEGQKNTGFFFTFLFPFPLIFFILYYLFPLIFMFSVIFSFPPFFFPYFFYSPCITPSSPAFLARNQPPILDHWWTLKENCPLNLLLLATPIASCSASYRPQGHTADPKQRMVFSLAGSFSVIDFYGLNKQTSLPKKKKKCL